MRLNRTPQSVPPARDERTRSKGRLPPSAELAGQFELQHAVGNRATANILGSIHSSGHKSWAPEGEKVEKKPEQIATEEAERGPKQKPKTWDADLKQAAEQASEAQSIQVKPVNERQGVRLVSKTKYDEVAASATNFHQEAGVPRAFLDSSNAIGPIQISTDSGVNTVLMQTRATGKNGGEVWVQGAMIPWTVKTAGYMDESRIDTAMIADYKRHEEGHATIAEQIRDQLAPLMQTELNQALPTAERPLRVTGKGWVKRGGDEIYEKVNRAVKRYERLWDELTERADDAWNQQERQTLSRIAAMKTFKPGEHVPE